MRYENAQLVINLIDQIHELKGRLISIDAIHTVSLQTMGGATLFRIDITDTECEYSEEADRLIGFIKSDLSMRIAKLKDQLSEL
jgi:hypothetical protein